MQHVEKKYKVYSFDSIKAKLSDLRASPLPSSTTHHYYAAQDSLNVTKLVVYANKAEIHIIQELNGTFELTQRLPVDSQEAGLKWLKDHGHSDITLVQMDSSDYDYDGGRVGIYTINEELLSVILDYPASKQAAMAELFELEKAEAIEQPYNKYLESNI